MVWEIVPTTKKKKKRTDKITATENKLLHDFWKACVQRTN